MDEMDRTTKAGPSLGTDTQELQGRFPTDAALQDAVSRLTLLGFDHADLSQPDPTTPSTTPEGNDHVAPSHIDNTQLRTMASGMTGAAAGIAVGAVVATAGIAAPLVAAAAGVSALGAVAATTGIGVTGEQAGEAERDRLGAEGKLILALRIRDATKLAAAEAAMRDAGATDVAQINQVDQALTRGVSSTSWTGN